MPAIPVTLIRREFQFLDTASGIAAAKPQRLSPEGAEEGSAGYWRAVGLNPILLEQLRTRVGPNFCVRLLRVSA